ncbi:MAG TPA: hypothetical protein VFS72_05785 [Agromyces sp.]|nr:hypothetical protein [Agromyces sp.]
MESPHGERRARASIRRPQPVLAAGSLIVAALLLGACASPAPVASTEPAPPTEATTPAPEPEPEPGAQPASRYDLTCDELVPPNLVSDMFDVPLGPVDPLVTAASAGISVPRMTSIPAVGGLACEWSNGEAYNSQFGSNPAYAGVLVTVVPKQDAGWSARATDAGMPVPGDSCGPDTCSMTRVPSGAWLAVFGAGGSAATIDPVGAASLADAAAAAVDGASPPAPAVAVDSGIPADCEGLVPTATVEALTGTTGLTVSTTGGGWSEWAEAKAIAGDLGCQWFPANSDESAAGAAWVRGGRWAFDRIEDAGALVPTPADAPIAVTGADRALVRCDAARGSCAVDLVIGPDWLQVSAPDEGRAIAIAEAIAAGLTS